MLETVLHHLPEIALLLLCVFPACTVICSKTHICGTNSFSEVADTLIKPTNVNLFVITGITIMQENESRFIKHDVISPPSNVYDL